MSQLVARFLPGERTPDYFVDKETRKGKFVIRLGSAVFGLFDSPQEAAAWAADSETIVIE